jgi:hypothetical protein
MRRPSRVDPCLRASGNAASLARGKSSKDISGERRSSVVTTKAQLKHILSKMHVNRQAAAIVVLDRLASFVMDAVLIASNLA